MSKKIICAVLAALMLTVSVFAAEGIQITAPEDFYSFKLGQSAKETAEILGMTEEELEDYCGENGIIYIAVNKDNSKQIRLVVERSAFSESVGNLSNLTEDKITTLIPDITGAESGEIIDKDGQLFIKTAESSSDSGGSYGVISYITVAAKKNYVLSFYTSSDTDSSYADEVFDSFGSEDFYNKKSEKSPYGYVIIAAIILLALGSAYIIFTLVRDIKSKRQDG